MSITSSTAVGNRINSLKTAFNKGSLWEAFKAGGYKALINGNFAETLLIYGPSKNAQHVGTDYNGNKYYEDITKQIGRHRWVVYGDLDASDPNTITPPWHAWIHYESDSVPTTDPPKAPIYEIAATANVTGTQKAYKPKGDWWNPKQRNWSKVQAWQPPSA